jgi:hypothetical protein
VITSTLNGQQRETLHFALSLLLRNTKAAVGTLTGVFLPTKAAEEQIERIVETIDDVPRADSIGRTFDLVEHRNGVCRNALILLARNIDKKVREAEAAQKVSTQGSEEKMHEIQNILRELGDERNLEESLNRKPNRELVEKDPAQMDLEEQAEQLETAGASA